MQYYDGMVVLLELKETEVDDMWKQYETAAWPLWGIPMSQPPSHRHTN